MKRIFKNMVPYWKAIILIVILLCVQAYCDLALPQYTADIIDVGIKNSGYSHIVPDKITSDEFNQAEIFMTDSEKTLWNKIYDKKDSNVYNLNVKDEEKLDEIDDTLLSSIVTTYQLGHMEEKSFRETVKGVMAGNPKTAQLANSIDKMSISDIQNMMHMDIKSFKAEDENGNQSTYVDMRSILANLIKTGQMDDSMLKTSRETMEKTMDSIGSDTLKSMGITYAVSCNSAAGIDVDAHQMSYLWTEGAKMFLMALIMLIAAVSTAYMAARVGAGVGRDMRGSLYKNVMNFSNTEMDKFSTASLITRCTNDVQQIQIVTAIMLRMILYAPIIGIGGIYKVAQTGANMGWVIGLAVLVILAFVGVLMGITLPKFKIMQKLVDGLNLVSREILTGLPVIRAFGREKTEEERFNVANTNLKKTQLFTNRVMTFMMPGMMLIMYCLVIGITWISSHRIDAGDLQVGAMTAFITYSMLIVMSFLMLTMMSIMLPRAGVAGDRIDEVMKTHSTIIDKDEPAKLSVHTGKVEFKNVSFRYPNAKEDVLSDINFTAEPGKVTAIIGSTGCGKSTLVSLIPRLYDVSSGTITVDDQDIRDVSVKDLRDAIGFVPQKGVLFSGTIDTNLRFGKKDATEDQIKEAVSIAQADTFIEEKEEKLESHIAQGGSNVSGGQKQRLAIARAIAKQPEILIFDDSFSALDMKTDAKLRKALGEKIKDTTQIIVAQRISTILHADRILVLDDGQIVGQGTHDQLMKSCQVYQQIAQSQLSKSELAKEASKEGGAK